MKRKNKEENKNNMLDIKINNAKVREISELLDLMQIMDLEYEIEICTEGRNHGYGVSALGELQEKINKNVWNKVVR